MKFQLHVTQEWHCIGDNTFEQDQGSLRFRGWSSQNGSCSNNRLVHNSSDQGMTMGGESKNKFVCENEKVSDETRLTHFGLGISPLTFVRKYMSAFKPCNFLTFCFSFPNKNNILPF